MTLNANFAGARVVPGKLEGSERGLDSLIGLVILIAVLLIGVLSLDALFLFGLQLSNSDAADAGFTIALFGSAIAVGIAILVYLVRIASGRRSWRAPLWGGILMAVSMIVGLLVMSSAL